MIDFLTLPDPDDRHVLAAAIRAGAQVIVTCNLKHFPAEALALFDIEALNPDDFLSSLFELAPEIVCAAVKRQRESLRNPPRATEEMLRTLKSQGLAQTVSRLRQHADLL